MAAIVAEELERGRVLYDGTTYTLNRQAFPEDVIEALARALLDGLRIAATAPQPGRTTGEGLPE
jgi:hypothetical protein